MGDHLIMWGFLVTFEDGTKYSEKQGTWLDMPHKPILRVELRTPRMETWTLDNFAQYFFNNEAVSIMPMTIRLGCFGGGRARGRIVAKLLGGINTMGNVVEYRSAKKQNRSKGLMRVITYLCLKLTGRYEIFVRHYREDTFPYDERILKG